VEAEDFRAASSGDRDLYKKRVAPIHSPPVLALASSRDYLTATVVARIVDLFLGLVIAAAAVSDTRMLTGSWVHSKFGAIRASYHKVGACLRLSGYHLITIPTVRI
jgi:hypothetical protein